MKTKLLAVLLFAGSTMFAGPRVFISAGFGGGYGYGYAPAPVPVYAAPPVAPVSPAPAGPVGQEPVPIDDYRELAGADTFRAMTSEPPADPEGDAGVERDPDDRDIHVLERVDQRQPRERGDAHEAGRQAGIGGLVARHRKPFRGAFW